jgi:archaemetzincin
MDSSSAIIGVVSLGEIPALVQKVIAAHISGYYNLPARILGPWKHPAYAFDEQRLQYNAGTILKNIEALPAEGCFKIVGILKVDIFVPIFKHVYGEARQGGRHAIVSLHRLGHNLNGSSAAQTSLYDRAAKVALHELGHLFNLPHCDDQKCLMHFSGALADLDGLSFNLCRYCRAYFKDALYEA